MLMNATAKRPRQQRQVVVLVVLFTALAVIVGIQVLPLLGGSPPPAHVVATPRPATSSAASARRPGTPPRSSPARGRASGSTAGQTARANGANVLSGVEEVHLDKLKQPE